MGGVVISRNHSYVQYTLKVISIRFVLAKQMKYIFLVSIIMMFENKVEQREGIV